MIEDFYDNMEPQSHYTIRRKRKSARHGGLVKRYVGEIAGKRMTGFMCAVMVAILLISLVFALGEQEYVNLEIIIFFKSRMESLQRLLQSIEAAEAVKHSVGIQIFFDGCISKSNPVYQRLALFKSKHGPVKIVCREALMGLKHNIISSWHPRSSRTFGIFLEDDLEVSPLFLKFSVDSIRMYGLSHSPKLFGVSLFNEIFSEVVSQPINGGDIGELFLYQQGQSWGSVYFPDQWNNFVAFFMQLPENFDPQLPFHTSVNNWDYRTSWKKYLLHYMYYNGLYMIFPNLKDRRSFSQHHAEPGEHFPAKPPTVMLENIFMPPLVKDEKYYPKGFPILENMEVFNMKFERVQSVAALRQIGPDEFHEAHSRKRWGPP